MSLGDPRVVLAGAGAVRVEPGVELESARVSLTDREGQRVVEGLRGLADRPRQVARPGLELRGVEGVAGRADLKHDRVQPDGLRAIEER